MKKSLWMLLTVLVVSPAWAQSSGTFTTVTTTGAAGLGVDIVGNAVVTEITNGATTLTAGHLVKLSGAPSTTVLTATTDTDGVVGVVINAPAASAASQVAINGQVSCVFENATTAGDYVIIGTATAGDCRDSGSSTVRPTYSQVIGRVLATGSAGSQNMTLGGLTSSASTPWSTFGNNIYNNNTGNVGIGVATPAQLLDIEGSSIGNIGLRILNTNSGSAWDWLAGSGGSINLSQNGVPRFQIKGSTGNISIGTSLSANPLDISGAVAIGSSYAGITAAPTNGAIIQGNVGIGSTAPTQRLDIGGGNIAMGYEQISHSCTGNNTMTCVATCSTGKQVIGGGCGVTTVSGGSFILQNNLPIASTTSWSCYYTGTYTSITEVALAICANMQ